MCHRPSPGAQERNPPARVLLLLLRALDPARLSSPCSALLYSAPAALLDWLPTRCGACTAQHSVQIARPLALLHAPSRLR